MLIGIWMIGSVLVCAPVVEFVKTSGHLIDCGFITYTFSK